MTLDPSLIPYFAAVAEYLSVSRAADSLGVSASTVSRKIEEVEVILGVRLFERDTRHLRLTEAGRDYLHYVQKAIYTLQQGQQSLAAYNQQILGELRIWCPPAFGRVYLSSAVAEFAMQYPELSISVQLEPRPFALGASEFDIGICVGMPSEGRVVISRLCAYQSSFVATPEFLHRHGGPHRMRELTGLPIVTVFHGEEMNHRSLINTESGEQLSYTSKLMVNDSSLALEAVLTGRYIGKIMHWYGSDALLTGKIVKVLPECTEEKILYAVVQARKGNPRKVQLFVDFLKNSVQSQMNDIEQRVHLLPYFTGEAGSISC